MQKFLEDNLKEMTVLNERASLASTLKEDKVTELDNLAAAIIESMKE